MDAETAFSMVRAGLGTAVSIAEVLRDRHGRRALRVASRVLQRLKREKRIEWRRRHRYWRVRHPRRKAPK